jgi:heat shock protein HslJ
MSGRRTRRTVGIAAAAASIAAVLGGCASTSPGTPSATTSTPPRASGPRAPMPASPGDVATSPPPAPSIRLGGSSWYWIGSVTSAGVVSPADPGRYNLEFLEDGQLAASVDCNTGTGSWQQWGSTLRIGPLNLTRKACPPPSDADRFTRQLAAVRSAQPVMGLLDLGLGDAGSLVMARDPDWRLRGYDCPGNQPPLRVAFGRDEAVVRWRGETWRLKPTAGGPGGRYASESTVLFSTATEASLVSRGRQLAGPCTARR